MQTFRELFFFDDERGSGVGELNLSLESARPDSHPVGAFSASTALVTWAPQWRGSASDSSCRPFAQWLRAREAVENGRGRRHATEKRAPILRRAIRGDQRRARFMSPHEDLEEIFSRARAEFLHAESSRTRGSTRANCGMKSRRAPVSSAWANSAARSNVLRTSACRPARIAPTARAVTAANVPDILQLEPLVAVLPAVAGRPGRPRRKPGAVQGDRGYWSRARHARLARARHRGGGGQARQSSWQRPRRLPLGCRTHPGLAASLPPPRAALRTPRGRQRSLPHARLRPHHLALPKEGVLKRTLSEQPPFGVSASISLPA